MSQHTLVHEPFPFTFDQIVAAVASEQQPSPRLVAARPFLKWVGGKRSILPQLLDRLPQTFTSYYEPFVGGGALFFSMQPKRAHLSDINLHLVLTYQAVRDDVEALIDGLKDHATKHSKEHFQRARKRLSVETDSTKVASLFIYLNKTCFNGLYRVNKSGSFNVPMGDYATPPILDEDNLRAASRCLEGAEIVQREFAQIKLVTDGFYYLDPPYHETYSGYSGKGFGEKEHIELAGTCRAINEARGHFMLSNSDTPLVRRLYKGYNIEEISASRSVSCKAHQRGKTNELLIRNYH